LVEPNKMWVEVAALLLVLLLLLYRMITKSFDKWERAGIAFKPGHFPYGSVNIFKEKKNFAKYIIDMSKEFKDERFFGWFLFGKPMLMIHDVELVKNIKVKDFNHFVDPQDEHTAKTARMGGELDQLFNQNVGSAKGEEWKDVRSSLSPIFTSGKMKQMLKFVVDVSKGLLAEMERQTEKGEFELKEVTGKFSLDALATCAFGLDFNSFSSESSNAFVENAAEVFKQDIWTSLVFLKFLPGLAKLFEFFNFNVQKPKQVKFFKEIVTKTLKQRAETGQRRNDMIDMMLDVINDIEKEKEEETENDQYHQDMKLSHKKRRKMTERDVISNLIVLLMVGYDTTGMTLAFILFALAENEEVQEKLQREVDEAWEDAGGEFPDYAKIQSLPYTEMVIMETLRFYNPIVMTIRACTEDYAVPGTNLVLKKNDMLTFNANHYHRDPKHWSHPDTFYPDHWTTEEKSKRNPHAFQGFGQGPRACLGMRFALLELKVAMVMIVRHLEMLPGTKTARPLELDKDHGFAWIQGGLWANIKKRDI